MVLDFHPEVAVGKVRFEEKVDGYWKVEHFEDVTPKFLGGGVWISEF